MSAHLQYNHFITSNLPTPAHKFLHVLYEKFKNFLSVLATHNNNPEILRDQKNGANDFYDKPIHSSTKVLELQGHSCHFFFTILGRSLSFGL